VATVLGISTAPFSLARNLTLSSSLAEAEETLNASSNPMTNETFNSSFFMFMSLLVLFLCIGF
jgi:hypothetical protein